MCWCGRIGEDRPYRGFTREELAREYSPSSCIGGDVAPFIARYEEESAAARRLPRSLEDVAYGETPARRLDLFRPLATMAPLHVFLHGGYWQELSHKHAATMARALVSHGIALAAINYTLAPHATIADMVRECRDALVFLCADARRLDVDASVMTVSGHSAGAHLAAMLLSDPGVAATVSGALLISGIYDLEPIRHTYIADPLNLDRDGARAFSPLFLAQPGCPRVQLVVGADETAEFHRQSDAFARHLVAQGACARLDVLPGVNHFDIVCDRSIVNRVRALHSACDKASTEDQL